MQTFWLTLLNIVSYYPLVFSTDLNKYEVIYEWKQLDYVFPSDTIRHEFLKNGSFIPAHCFPAGVEIYGNLAFLTTPRFLNGVPSTLNVVSYMHSFSNKSIHGKEGPKLIPFPSWEMQEIGNCSALQLVQSMELDSHNRLWIVDSGRTPSIINPCPAKLVIYDLLANKVDRLYNFPEDMVPKEGNSLRDIQVVCFSPDDCFSYISNLNATCAIVVYDYRHNDSWVATHSTMQPDLTQTEITIDGVTTTVSLGLAGLGVTPKSTNYSTVFYSRIAGDHIYSIPTAVLQDGGTLKKNRILSDDQVIDYGVKPWGKSDGTAMDHRGRWFMGSLSESAVYFVDTSLPNITEQLKVHTSFRLVQNAVELQWPDLFSFDGQGNMVFTTNRFNRFITGKMDFNEINFRLVKIKTDSFAYNS